MSMTTDAPVTTKTFPVYVCPDPDCPSYYGSNTMPDLHHSFTGPKEENRHAFANGEGQGSAVRHTRANCPVCRKHERVLVMATAVVPTTGPQPPEFPKF